MVFATLMEVDRPTLAAKVDELAAKVSRLEARVAELERAPRAAWAEEPSRHATSRPPQETELRVHVALAGRSLILLGGAFLLRAAADARLIPVALGAVLGLLYAAALLVWADRTASHEATASSTFQFATALVILMPLVFEMVTRFQILDARGAAALLAGACAGTTLLARRHRQAAMAWIGSAAIVGVALVLAVQTRSLVPSVWVLIAVLASAHFLRRELDQGALPWPPAVLGSLLLFVLGELALAEASTHGPWPTLLATAAFFALGAGAPLLSAALERRPTSLPDMAQVAIVFLATVVEGSRVAQHTSHAAAFGAILLGIAAAGFAIALFLREPLRTSGFWSTFWLVTALAALGLLAHGAVLAAAGLALAFASMLAARRFEPALLELQAVLALVAAAITSGLLGAAGQALVGPPEGLAAPTAMAWLVLAALLASAVMGIPEPRSGVARVRQVAKVAALGLALFCAAGALAWLAITRLHASAQMAATVRTGILAVGAVSLAAISRHPRERSAGMLVYPVLFAIAAKLAFEDLRVGVAGTLFVGLLVYGVALIVAPRLRGTRSTPLASRNP